MKKMIMFLSLIIGLIFATSLFAGDSAYDQATGTSGDSWNAEKESANPGKYDQLNSSWERSRSEAGSGFDTPRSSNLSGGGMQYIPTPTPKIDRENSQ